MRASRFHRDESRVSGVDAFRASPLRSFPDPDRPPDKAHPVKGLVNPAIRSH